MSSSDYFIIHLKRSKRKERNFVKRNSQSRVQREKECERKFATSRVVSVDKFGIISYRHKKICDFFSDGPLKKK